MTSQWQIEQLTELAEETSIRGKVARLALQRIDQAGPEAREIIESALQLLLEKFAGEGGGSR